MNDQEPDKGGMTLTRRSFLGGVAASLAGGTLLRPSPTIAAGERLRMPLGAQRSRVARVQCRHAVLGPDINRRIVAEMLEKTLTSLTETSTAGQAWQEILRPDDVIGLKFNRSARKAIASTDVVADTLITSIIEAGWRPDRIVCIEAPPETSNRHGTAPAVNGFSDTEIDFGSGSDQFASVLEQVTALISVPFLKTHNIAGMTCSLKNLSHALVKHPARYHGNGCSPYIADIVASEPIRNKLRLCLVDALRVVYEGGPEANSATISDEGMLMASTDPVATDVVGLATLNEIRQQRDLAPIARTAGELGYLADAHRVGLGIALWHGIDLEHLRL